MLVPEWEAFHQRIIAIKSCKKRMLGMYSDPTERAATNNICKLICHSLQPFQADDEREEGTLEGSSIRLKLMHNNAGKDL